MFFKRQLFFNELTYQYEEKFITDYKLITILQQLTKMTFPYATEEGTSRFAFTLHDERFSVHESVLIEKLVHNDLLFFKDHQLHLPARSHFASILYQAKEDGTQPIDKHRTHVVPLSSDVINKTIHSLFEGDMQKTHLYLANLHQSMNYQFFRDFRLERITQQEVKLPSLPDGAMHHFRTAVDLGVTRFEVVPYIDDGIRQIVFYGRCLEGEALLTIILSEDVHGLVQ